MRLSNSALRATPTQVSRCLPTALSCHFLVARSALQAAHGQIRYGQARLRHGALSCGCSLAAVVRFALARAQAPEFSSPLLAGRRALSSQLMCYLPGFGVFRCTFLFA